MYRGKNLVSIAAFKKHYALWFFQGSLLQENTAMLTNAQEGKTQAMRQIKLEKGDDLDLDLIIKHIEESIKQSNQGKTMKRINSPVRVSSSPEITALMEGDDQFRHSFLKLTPGRQKEYIYYITEAKREETKSTRLAKIVALIKGKGLNDK